MPGCWKICLRLEYRFNQMFERMISNRPLAGDRAMFVLPLIPVRTFLVRRRGNFASRILLSLVTPAVSLDMTPLFLQPSVTTSSNGCRNNFRQHQKGKRK